jgi:hypothetical protein
MELIPPFFSFKDLSSDREFSGDPDLPQLLVSMDIPLRYPGISPAIGVLSSNHPFIDGGQ